MVLMKGHPRANDGGYVFEHIVVVEKMIGRYLMKGEVVHHLNGIKDDNRPDNLVIEKRSDHSRDHKKLRIEELKKCGFRLEKMAGGRLTGYWIKENKNGDIIRTTKC